MNFGEVSFPVTAAGIMMITMTKATIFNVEPKELYLAIHRVGMLEIHA